MEATNRWIQRGQQKSLDNTKRIFDCFKFRLKISLPKILLIYFPTHPLRKLSKRCLENLRFQDPAQFAQ